LRGTHRFAIENQKNKGWCKHIFFLVIIIQGGNVLMVQLTALAVTTSTDNFNPLSTAELATLNQNRKEADTATIAAANLRFSKTIKPQ
jgi:hypothetical protein